MTIFLIDGSQVDSGEITFLKPTQQFFVADASGKQINISDLLTQHDKIILGGEDYDVNADLIRRSEQKQHKKAPSLDSTSSFNNWLDNLGQTLSKTPEKGSNALFSLAVIVIGLVLLVKWFESE